MYFSKHQVQNAEQRSIAIFEPKEGPQSLPLSIDRSCFKKNEAEKANLATMRSEFKHSCLREWNERNRPGNNR
jgi:hypothetical protein